MDASPQRIENISNAVRDVRGVGFKGARLVVSAEYVASSSDLEFSMLEKLNGVISDRYDGPVVND